MARKTLIFAAFLGLFGCRHARDPAAPPESAVTAHYMVTTLDNFRGARVRMCFEGGPVRELVPIHESATPLIRQTSLDGDRLDVQDDRIRLFEPQGGCVDYETRFQRSWYLPKGSSAVVISHAQWLWRPHPFPKSLDATVRFVLRDDERVSLPWPQRDGVYLLEESAFFTDAYSVFGTFDQRQLEIAGTHVEIARLGAQPTDAAIGRWLGRAMGAAASPGFFPRDRVHFVIAPANIAANRRRC